MTVLSHLRPAVVMIGLFTLVTGVAYPLVVTGVAHVAMPVQAGGSLIKAADGQLAGSALLAQGFAKPQYLHPRGSSAGNGYELQAIAAVVIGGGSLHGGEGSVIGTLIGALIMGLLSNGSDLLGISPYLQQAIIGAVIILAVSVDELRKRRGRAEDGGVS